MSILRTNSTAALGTLLRLPRPQWSDAVAVSIESPQAGSCHPLQSAWVPMDPGRYGGRMRRIAIGLGLAVSLLGCSGEPPRGEQVPIRTATAGEDPGHATFANLVVDVVADPETGTPVIKNDAEPMRWPSGYTAWRWGSETEVLDASGKRVLVTGHRYRLYLGHPLKSVIVIVETCPPGTCAVLGFHLDHD